MPTHPLTTYKTILSKRLSYLLNQKQNDLAGMKWGPDVCARLRPLLLGGKMVRGSAILGTYERLARHANTTPVSVIDTACAIEIVQTGLIIHDDILDKSTLRRGSPSMQIQYRQVVSDGGRNSNHIADMFALCIGDMCFHWASEVLTGALTDLPYQTVITKALSRELEVVQLAQMTDMTYSGSAEPDESEILSLYAHKTARYSFALPLTLAAILAGSSPDTISHLEAIGERIGVLFQLVDDDIGIFGNVSVTGKSVVTDISENKKTLLRHILFRYASSSERSRLTKIFGSSTVSDTNLRYVKDILTKSGARQHVADRMKSMQKEIQSTITAAPLPEKMRQFLERLLELVVQRKN